MSEQSQRNPSSVSESATDSEDSSEGAYSSGHEFIPSSSEEEDTDNSALYLPQLSSSNDAWTRDLQRAGLFVSPLVLTSAAVSVPGSSSHASAAVSVPGSASHTSAAVSVPGSASHTSAAVSVLGSSSHTSAAVSVPGSASHTSAAVSVPGSASHTSAAVSVPGSASHTSAAVSVPGSSSHTSSAVSVPGSASHTSAAVSVPGSTSHTSAVLATPDTISHTSAAVSQSDISSHSSTSVVTDSLVTIHTASRKNGKRVYDKKNCCKFCEACCTKLSKHLFSKHKDETEVASIMSKPKGSTERDFLLEKLRNEGNYQHNCEVLKTRKGEIIPWRSPSENCDPFKYLPCEFCLGFFFNKELWRHEKACRFRTSDKKGRKVTYRSSAMLPAEVSCSEGLKENVLSSMAADKVSKTARNDFLIIKYGERMYSKHGHLKHMRNHMRQKIRELARFLHAVREQDPSITDLRSAIHPEKFSVVISAVQKLYGYDSSKNFYANPSLAKKLGHSFKKCAHILRSEALMSSNDSLNQTASAFLSLCESDWTEHISSCALATLEANKYNRPHVLPLTEDMKKLTNYMIQERKHRMEELKSSPTTATWHAMAKICLTNIIMFNRRRSGEASRMLLTDFEAAECNAIPEDDVAAALSDLEKHLVERFTRVVIRGKRGRRVPVLLTALMCQEIRLLCDLRPRAGINPCNPFVFARPYLSSEDHLAGHECLRDIVGASEVEQPQHITSTKLRKHLATVTQILNMNDHELEQVCSFLGHDISVHREYYRLPQDTYQLAKVSRLLLAAEQGQINRFQGKSLSEIHLDDCLSFQDSEMCIEDRSDNESENEGQGMVADEAQTSSAGSSMYRAARPEAGQAMAQDDEPMAQSEHLPVCSVKKTVKKRGQGMKDFLTPAQTSAIRVYFQRYIRDCRLPGKKECQKMIDNEPFLQGKDWKKIKWTVRNQIEKKKRAQNSLFQK